jgi:acyl carrier protein
MTDIHPRGPAEPATAAVQAGSPGLEPADVYAVISSFIREETPDVPDGFPTSALLHDLDVDSLGLVDLLTRLETELDVVVPDEHIASISSVADLIEQVLTATSRPA